MRKFLIILSLVLTGFIFIFITKSPSTNKRNRKAPPKNIITSLPTNFKSENTEQIFIKAYTLYEENKYKEAIELYRFAIQLESENPRLWFDLANCYMFMNNPQKAISLMDTAIILDNSCSAFYNNRGYLYYSLNDFQNAIQDLKKAIKLDRGNWVSYLNIALAYYTNNNFYDACIAIDSSKLLCPDWNQTKGIIKIEELNEVCK